MSAPAHKPNGIVICKGESHKKRPAATPLSDLETKKQKVGESAPIGRVERIYWPRWSLSGKDRFNSLVVVEEFFPFVLPPRGSRLDWGVVRLVDEGLVPFEKSLESGHGHGTF